MNPPAPVTSGESINPAINPITRRVRTRASTTVKGSVRVGLFWSSVLRHTALRTIEHDCLNVAQSAAYSSIIALFPALIATAAIVALLPHAAPVRAQFADFFSRVLPADVVPVLGAYFAPTSRTPQSARAIAIGVVVSIYSASGVIATLMEGFRRAHDLSPDCWSFWQRRLRALILVPLSLLPFAAASLLVVFGEILTKWLALHLTPSIRPTFSVGAFCLRWTVALAGSVGLIAVIYNLGSPLREPWQRKIPGATAATVMWFVSTLLFGLYVTRYANYGQVYGSLGAGIALLFWLFIISLSVLCGEECNAELATRKARPASPLPVLRP